ncbi:MAG: hypothetical protein F4148_16560, partial [Caldilineaceae bacterium SB0675_bin_29]|nr:hypothetical protein [Caldilineaceae bacterium SB0675_bin_29]
MNGRAYHYAIRAIDAQGVAGEWTSSPYPYAFATSTPQTELPEERAALIALYNATDGPNWRHSDNWLSSQPVSTWYGVFTDSNGSVERLELTTNGLSGEIPDLSALSNLTVLELYNNNLTGTFPDLSALTRLSKLALHDNQLSGDIESHSTLTNL